MDQFNDILALACIAHAGQYDKAGVPYVFHIMSVTEYTRQRWGHEDLELLMIAAGHDLIEDTDVDYDFILEYYGKRVADGIFTLSKVNGIKYEDYVAGVLNSVDAMKVKLCDLRHNMQADRVLQDERTEKRMAKYAKLRDMIEEKLNEIGVS